MEETFSLSATSLRLKVERELTALLHAAIAPCLCLQSSGYCMRPPRFTPGQSVGAARAARLPGAARRDGGGRADSPARCLCHCPRRCAGVGVLRLRRRDGGV